ncbi:hypothetical protein [Rhizobium pisi]
MTMSQNPSGPAPEYLTAGLVALILFIVARSFIASSLQLKERLRYDGELQTGKRIKKNLSAREQYAPLIVKPSGRAELRYTSHATHLNLSPAP